MARLPKCRPSFFKVMFAENFTTKLQVPPAFVKEFEGMMSNKSILETNQHPEKSSWLVDMVKVKKKYYFGNGWMEFAKDHHLETGDFLVFFLLGHSKFQVIIYDKTCCPKNRASPILEQDCAVENVKTVKMSRVKKMESKVEDVVEIPPFAKSEHLQFETILKKYSKYSLYIPKDFAIKTGLARKRKCILKDPEGREWPVTIYERDRFMFGNGWFAFVTGNKIAKGDKCVFQLIHNYVIKVDIFHKRGGGSGPSGRRCCAANNLSHVVCTNNMNSPGKTTKSFDGCAVENVEPARSPRVKMESKIEEMVEIAQVANPEHHQFVTIFKKYNKKYLCVPMGFATKTGIALNTKVILKDPEGRAWAVFLHENGRFVLRSGLSDFAEGNKLALGDKCVFHYIHANVIKVDIVRKGGRGRCKLAP